MADFLDAKRDEIKARLQELRPLVDEHARLEAALAALDGLPAAIGETAPTGRGTTHRSAKRARRRGEHPASAATRGRPKGTGTRAKEALQIVSANPGITIPQIAEKLGIKQNYLYRVLPGLAEDGLVVKDGRGWHPKAAA